MVFLLALAVGLVLADSSVVTLALPEILREFDASVAAVAWVLIAFNLALALAALPAARALLRGRARGAFAAAILAFAAASALCAAAPSLGVLVGGRVAQGLAGAVVVAAALELLVARLGRGPALARWGAAGVLGAAVGPAAGGFLTEAFSWEAMFALQAPVALVALGGVRPGERRFTHGARARDVARPAPAPLAALALLSAALSAALFLLVLLLIEGWRDSPAEAALTVTVLPLAALLAGRAGRALEARSPVAAGAAGSLLVAGGLAALGLLPGSGAAWTIAPQAVVGAGLGIALAALVGASVGAGSPGLPAAWTIAARHAGIVAGLLVLTPIFTGDLERAQPAAEQAGIARLLDAPLSLDTKADLALALDDRIAAADGELPELAPAFAAIDAPPDERAALTALRADLEDELDRAGAEAFDRSFLAGALLALLALAPLALAARGRRARPRAPGLDALGTGGGNGRAAPAAGPLRVAVPGAAAVALALVAAYAALGGGGYGPTGVTDPCAARVRADPATVDRPQRVLLAALDGAACELGASRETVLLSLLGRDRPGGATDAQLADALRAGVGRAREEGALTGTEAAALTIALATGGTDAVIGLLLGPR